MADKEGWLFKKKRAGKNKTVAWTKRWFVLRGTQLTYFKSQEEYAQKSRAEKNSRLAELAERKAEDGDDTLDSRVSGLQTTEGADKRTLDIQGASVRPADDKNKSFPFHITHFVWGTLTLAAESDTSRQGWIQVLERASKAGHKTYNGALELLGLTNDASPEDINLAYNTLVEKHRPEVGGDAKSFKFYTDAYKFAMQHVKAQQMSEGPKSTVTITKQPLAKGGLGLRVRMRPGGGIEVTNVISEELKSQVEVGDVIMSVNGEVVDTTLSFTEFYELVKKLPEGTESEWQFMRPEKSPAEEPAAEGNDVVKEGDDVYQDSEPPLDEGKLQEESVESWHRAEADPPSCSSVNNCMSFSGLFGFMDSNKKTNAPQES